MASASTTVDRLLRVDLCGLGHGKTKANKLPVPAGAEVYWTPERFDMLILRRLDSGAGRDVFECDAAPYVLKLQCQKWHAQSNAVEAALADSPLKVWMPQIYGAVVTQFQGRGVSVLVAERVPHTMTTWTTALMAPKPSLEAALLFRDVIGAFFRMVVAVAGDLDFMIVDLHWGNVGITKENAVVLVDCEGMGYAPSAKPTVKYGSGVAAWLKHFGEVAAAANHRAGAWGPLLSQWITKVSAWWTRYTQWLPNEKQIAVLCAGLADSAAVLLPGTAVALTPPTVSATAAASRPAVLQESAGSDIRPPWRRPRPPATEYAASGVLAKACPAPVRPPATGSTASAFAPPEAEPGAKQRKLWRRRGPCREAAGDVPPLPPPELAIAASEDAPVVSGGESPSSEPEAGVPRAAVQHVSLSPSSELAPASSDEAPAAPGGDCPGAEPPAGTPFVYVYTCISTRLEMVS